MKKFQDSAEILSDFYEYSIIECPNCSKPVDFRELTVTCIHCGYHKKVQPSKEWRGLIPLHFEVKYYLEIPCCGQELWAVNLEHLEFIEKYVESDLRERVPNKNRSLASRLPQWIKSKKNRAEILRCIQKLRDKLEREGYVRRTSAGN